MTKETQKMIIEMLKYILTGMSIGFTAILKVLPLLSQLTSTKNQIIASCIGVPVFAVPILKFVVSIVKRFINY